MPSWPESFPAEVASWVTTRTAGLVGKDEEHRPLGQLDRLAEAVALPVEARPEAETGLAQVRDHRQGLHGQPEEGSDAQQPHAVLRDGLHSHVGLGRGAVDPDEEAERGDHDDVVEDGVHIIAPNLPRAFRIWPITTWTPMKKIVGRQ